MKQLVRFIFFAASALFILLPACSKNKNSHDDSDSQTDSETDSDADSSGTDTDPPTVCTPNQTDVCDCDQNAIGVTRCAADGSGWSTCECVDYGMELFVSPGSSAGDGSIDAPFGTITDAQTVVRQIIADGELPAGGIVVWLRGGEYRSDAPLTITSADSGTAEAPVTYRGYPGESARILGDIPIDSALFTAVNDSSSVWERLDADARNHIVQLNLDAAGITDLGELQRRGFCGEGSTSPPELIFNNAPMTLARWPDVNEGEGDIDVAGDQVEIFGELTPNVTGTYQRIDEHDDASVFERDGLVDGVQYYLYRYYWEYDGTWHRAWFLTSDEMGYPTDTAPWWYLYAETPGPLNPSNGAEGTATFTGPETLRHGFSYITGAVSDTAFTYGGSRPERWSDAADVWFHGYWAYSWAECRIAAAAIDTETKTVTLADENGYGMTEGQPFYAFNLLEEITAPGEYYIDRESRMLYLYPPTAVADASLSITTDTGYLIDVNNAAYVQIRDLTLANSRYHLARVTGGNHVLFDGVTLENSGGRGITIAGEQNGITNCFIQNVATTGITLEGGDRPTLTPGGNFTENCHIRKFGRLEWTYRTGVRISDVGNRANNNLIYDAPHTAILFGGNEHEIARNDIHHVCQYSSDAGAVYSGRDWGARGNRIENNFVHHVHTKLSGAGVQGIYLDDCLSGIYVFGNILYDIEDHAIQHGGGRDNLFENNIMVKCGDAINADTRGYDWYPDRGFNNTPGSSWNLLEKLQNVGYQNEPWASTYPECAAIPNDFDTIVAEGATWLYPEGCTFRRNLGYDNDAWMQGGDAFDYYTAIENNIENADPLFADEENLDMTLLPGSPALSIPGFEPIPFSQIGVQAE
ncbi:MAG: right-handed parallel beta-helix repeat-containing protein [Deltaproteobacteria bacterium]|nr:right-handed parallel beta-helix repeat-containing protein [Deltaproteobacteria bacterium]